MMQGAWGIVPVHLNELSPDGDARHVARLRLSSCGNLLASFTSPLLAGFALKHGGDYAFAMSCFIAAVSVLLALVTWLGPEARGALFGAAGATGSAAAE